MFTLGIPKSQYRRTTQVLSNERSNPINYDSIKQDDGFYIFSFPGADEFDFKDIVKLLRSNGITTIGADDQLTEKKIMKLTDLLKEAPNLGESVYDPILNALKRTLQSWSSKQYIDDKNKWEEFTLDIEELIQDFEEEKPQPAVAVDSYRKSNMPSLEEQKLRKLIRKTIRQ